MNITDGFKKLFSPPPVEVQESEDPRLTAAKAHLEERNQELTDVTEQRSKAEKMVAENQAAHDVLSPAIADAEAAAGRAALAGDDAAAVQHESEAGRLRRLQRGHAGRGLELTRDLEQAVERENVARAAKTVAENQVLHVQGEIEEQALLLRTKTETQEVLADAIELCFRYGRLQLDTLRLAQRGVVQTPLVDAVKSIASRVDEGVRARGAWLRVSGLGGTLSPLEITPAVLTRKMVHGEVLRDDAVSEHLPAPRGGFEIRPTK